MDYMIGRIDKDNIQYLVDAKEQCGENCKIGSLYTFTNNSVDTVETDYFVPVFCVSEDTAVILLEKYIETSIHNGVESNLKKDMYTRKIYDKVKNRFNDGSSSLPYLPQGLRIE